MEKLEEDSRTYIQRILDNEKKIKVMFANRDKQLTKVSDHEALHEKATSLDQEITRLNEIIESIMSSVRGLEASQKPDLGKTGISNTILRTRQI
jgi:hypothetical protein